MARVVARSTPLYKDPDHQRRLISSSSLGAGALVVGAVVAVVVSVLVAYLVTTVTGLLN